MYSDLLLDTSTCQHDALLWLTAPSLDEKHVQQNLVHVNPSEKNVLK